MNSRERFLRIMSFEKGIASVKWEFGYWGETINKWYKEGLPKNKPAIIPSDYTSTTASLYTRAWTCENRYTVASGEREYPKGIGIIGGGLHWPTNGFAHDSDVKDFFGMDNAQRVLDLNLLFHPNFEVRTFAEDEDRLEYRDLDGVVRSYLKEPGVMAAGIEWPIRDEKTWNKLKTERLNVSNIRDRFPDNWDQLVDDYKSRDYPLVLGGYPHGFFGTPAHLMGYEKLFYSYYDNPRWIHNILNTFLDLWLAVYEEVLGEVEIDAIHIWEDVSSGQGSMVSPAVVREFMLPYYKRLSDFCRSHGIDIILVDTDGMCMDLIPIFLEGGVTGVYPIEATCGMDIVEVRKQFPELQMLGGIPKSEIGNGEKRIDEILEPIKTVLPSSGYIPFADHFIPPEVGFPEFSYYRQRLNQIIEQVE